MSGHTEVFRGVDGRYLAARWHDLFTYYYVAQDSTENIAAYRSWIVRHKPQFPQGIATTVWVDSVGALNPPSSEVREIYAEVAANSQIVQRARLNLVEAEGFAGATVRGVLTGMNLLRRLSIPQHVAKDPVAGMTWLFSVLPPAAERKTPKEAAAFFKGLIVDYRANR